MASDCRPQSWASTGNAGSRHTLIDTLDDFSRQFNAMEAGLTRLDLLEATDDLLSAHKRTGRHMLKGSNVQQRRALSQAQRGGGIVRVCGVRDRFEATQRVDGCADLGVDRYETVRDAPLGRGHAKQARAVTREGLPTGGHVKHIRGSSAVLGVRQTLLNVKK